jgi:NitT/TauT family transport system substrate-binding protein
MTISLDHMNRRQLLAATGAAVLGTGFGIVPAAAADVTIRQGYQTNIWGMPTYYLMKSGYLEKHGLKTEDFAVPSGNLTMQQMVARQVDMGTYAGPSFILGHDKGGLIAIAQIETVGATGAMVVRKDLGIKTMADLKGKKIANQTGSSIGNIFVDQVGPANGLKKGDFQEVRMDVNNMIAAMAAKTVDAMINVEPYNAIAEAEGMGTIIMDLSKYDKVPVFMAATPDFVEKNGDAIVGYLKAWLQVKQDIKDNPKKVSDVIYSFFASKGYKMDPKTFTTAMGRVEVDPGFPHDLVPYLTHHAEVLVKEKKISKMPDWKVALRTEFMDKALKG